MEKHRYMESEGGGDGHQHGRKPRMSKSVPNSLETHPVRKRLDMDSNGVWAQDYTIQCTIRICWSCYYFVTFIIAEYETVFSCVAYSLVIFLCPGNILTCSL